VATLSDKYIAGFLDSDGCISVNLKQGKYKPLLHLNFSQKTGQDKVLSLIQDAIGGVQEVKELNGSSYSAINLSGSAAEKALNRIKKHLVIKRRYADVCLDMVMQRTAVDVETARAYLKAQRREASLPLPNFPPRKWLAGYFDGDGCVTATRRGTGSAVLAVSIASSSYDQEGISIIAKNFGGGVYAHGNESTTRLWQMALPPSKAKEFFGYFAKHMITKRDQAEFVLGCAAMGHYRDGETIKAVLKQLKAREHRLSIPDVNVSELVATVKASYWASHGRSEDGCIDCGTVVRKHYGFGRCQSCYDKSRKQQSERHECRNETPSSTSKPA
jgi:hypothetical protein